MTELISPRIMMNLLEKLFMDKDHTMDKLGDFLSLLTGMIQFYGAEDFTLKQIEYIPNKIQNIACNKHIHCNYMLEAMSKRIGEEISIHFNVC